MDDLNLKAVVESERLLLDPEVRKNAVALNRLLHPEFLEFGSSGRVWTRGEIVDALVSDPAIEGTMTDVRPVWIGAGVALVTYRLVAPGRETLRSSIWLRDSDETWRLRFHQGTVREVPRD